MDDGGSAEPRGAREAFERAVGAVGRRERSVAELSTWLAERGYEPAVVEETVGRLVELGELDDARFARAYAEDKRDLRAWGAERIRAALLARGIDRRDVEAALAADSSSAQVARARALLARRGGALATEADRARALAYLTRRGYDYEVAYEAVRRHEREAA